MDYESLLKPPLSRVLKSGKVTLMPGENVGRHVTESREEIIIVLNGEIVVQEGSKETYLIAGMHHYVPLQIEHDVLNKSTRVATYIYVVALLEKYTGE